jgi:hypothetical protein
MGRHEYKVHMLEMDLNRFNTHKHTSTLTNWKETVAFLKAMHIKQGYANIVSSYQHLC